MNAVAPVKVVPRCVICDYVLNIVVQVHLTASAPSRNQAELQQFHNSYEPRQMLMRKRSLTTLSDTNNETQAGSTDHRNDSTPHVRTRRLFWGVSSFRCSLRRRMISALTLGRLERCLSYKYIPVVKRNCVAHGHPRRTSWSTVTKVGVSGASSSAATVVLR